jgi:hypothetical protein
MFIKTKTVLGVFLAISLAVGQASTAFAAPQRDPLVGTIDGVSEGTDAGGNTIIIVNYTDSDGMAQVAELTVDEAVALGLVSVDPTTGEITILAVPGTPIDLTDVLFDPCALPEGADQPVGEALTGFFCGSLGVDYSTIELWHMNGYGFGVIAQALFMAQSLGGDMALAQAILDAKKSGDYSALLLPEDVNNWGRLRKYVLSEAPKSLTNLGAIMSGRATPVVTGSPTEETALSSTASSSSTTLLTNGNGKGKGAGHGKGGGHGNGKGKGH